ncbi:HutD family protein [Providencia alcalifaciens]|jgi:environmental stress-induced protein Ves|uniref:HutD/Ves family protein n=1 Tax=Providencia TaxID=586 RepID=UPI000D3C9969|nr:HutD family protein [Providencia alcalifaciens]MBG5883998.1 HutD family protein [Providencia alcalifaciens]MDR2242139.1 HutD family protein [Providencia alcalifaciens]
MIQKLTAQDYKKMPWKNGQGFTLELARSHGEGLENFDWRVSIADVKSAGSFSFFPNKQRIIGVLEGTGIVLQIDKNSPVSLLQKQFHAFNGESDVYAELINEAIRDFNLIYNPEKYSARLQWVSCESANSWISNGNCVLIFNLQGKLELQVDGQHSVLNDFETLLVEKTGAPTQYIASPECHGDFCVIELFER